jgi:hypothetical protein
MQSVPPVPQLFEIKGAPLCSSRGHVNECDLFRIRHIHFDAHQFIEANQIAHGQFRILSLRQLSDNVFPRGAVLPYHIESLLEQYCQALEISLPKCVELSAKY